jgi:hypothetical protein
MPPVIVLTAQHQIVLRKSCHNPSAATSGRNDNEQQKTAIHRVAPILCKEANFLEPGVRTAAFHDPNPKALACYGLLVVHLYCSLEPGGAHPLADRFCCKKSGRNPMDIPSRLLFRLGCHSKQAGNETGLLSDLPVLFSLFGSCATSVMWQKV